MICLISNNNTLKNKLTMLFSSRGVVLKHIGNLQDFETVSCEKSYFIVDLMTIKDISKLTKFQTGTILLLTTENIKMIEENEVTIRGYHIFEFLVSFKQKKEEIIWLRENVFFNRKRKYISNNGNIYSLTMTEYKMLSLFIDNRGDILTMDDIINSVWGIGYPIGTDSLYVYINRLRKKIESLSKRPKLLVTKRGVGYSLLLDE